MYTAKICSSGLLQFWLKMLIGWPGAVPPAHRARAKLQRSIIV
jgi:hypothetical protein